MNLLELKNARLRRADQELFSQLNLVIPGNANTAILGPNGSGKSSLLKLINRELYIQPHSRSYCRLFGQENWNVSRLRRQMRVVSHDMQARLFGDSTGVMAVLSGIYDSLTTWAHQEYSADDLLLARRWMSYFGVLEMEQRPVAAMSTGQQRRILLARAMVTEPAYLILDEPTSALDVAARSLLLELLSQLMQKGHYTLMVTHQVEELLPQLDYLVLLREGQVMDAGPPDQMLTGPILSQLFSLPLEVFRDEQGWHCRPRGTS